MKTLFHYSFTLLSMVVITFSVIAQPTGKAEVTADARNLGNYTSISLNVPASLSVSQSAEFSFRMEGNPELLDQVIAEVKGGELVIKFKDSKRKSSNDNNFRIFIQLPAINGLELNGSGNITALTDINTEHLNLEVNGSGDMRIKKITVATLSAEINGSGSILEITGNANSVTFAVNGSGNINAENLQCKKASASTTGSGNIAAGSAESIDANITGSGEILYKGNPASVKKNIVGSGNVSQR